MLQITATDLKLHLGKYLEMAKDVEIRITKKGKDIAVLSAPKPESKEDIFDRLRGIIPDTGEDTKDYRTERRESRYADYL